MMILMPLSGSWRLSLRALRPFGTADASPRKALLASFRRALVKAVRSLRREAESQMGEADFTSLRAVMAVLDVSGACSRTVAGSLNRPWPALATVQNLSSMICATSDPERTARSTASAAVRLQTSRQSVIRAIARGKLEGYGLADGLDHRALLAADVLSLSCDVPEHRGSENVRLQSSVRFFAGFIAAASLLAGELALLASMFRVWVATIAGAFTPVPLISATAVSTLLVRRGDWEYETRLHREMTDTCAELRRTPSVARRSPIAVQRRLASRSTQRRREVHPSECRQSGWAEVRNRSQDWRAVGSSQPQNRCVVLNYAWRAIQPERALASVSFGAPLSCRGRQALTAA
jgi:hypothetical protein